MRIAHWKGAVLLVASFVACSVESPSSATAPQFDLAGGESGPSASGHGNWFNAFGEGVSRSFHAHVMPDGTVQGEFVQHVTALDGVRRKNQSEIDCILLLAPNDAMLSGVVKVNVNPAVIGQIQIFRVIDDGEGSEAVDRQSAVFFRPPAMGLDCRNFPPPPATPIESGNIQVKP